MLAAFLAVETQVAEPLIPLALFRNQTIAIAAPTLLRCGRQPEDAEAATPPGA